MNGNQSIFIRSNLKPDDIKEIISLHRLLYAQEYGFDKTFEQYVAKHLHEFAKSYTHRENIWIVEHRNRIQGCIAIVQNNETAAQLRWFLVHPHLRGKGLGKKLITDAIQFARENGYASIFLWTVNLLERANKIYTTLGFQLTDEKAHTIWGQYLIEQRYELVF